MGYLTTEVVLTLAVVALIALVIWRDKIGGLWKPALGAVIAAIGFAIGKNWGDGKGETTGEDSEEGEKSDSSDGTFYTYDDNLDTILDETEGSSGGTGSDSGDPDLSSGDPSDWKF